MSESNNNSENEVYKPLRFFKKVWYSVTKIEKYPAMSAEGLGRAIAYCCKIIAILAIVIGIGTIYQASNMVQGAINYLQNDFPDFSYKDGILDVQSDEVIKISPDNLIVGKVIVDTKTEDVSTINNYIDEIEQSESGVIVLKNKVILKNPSVAGTINYDYKETFSKFNISQFTKQDVINYASSSGIIGNLYVSIFLAIFIYSFVMYLLTTLTNAVLLSILGLLTTLFAKIRMRYVAIFNMSIYALTLSTILNIAYIAVNIFIPFEMQYFQLMYVAVAAIYLISAIFLLKADFVRKQSELMKLAEKQQLLEQEKENQKEEEKNEKEREERRKKDKEEEKKGEGETPEPEKT